NLSLEVKKGEFFTLLGPSGCGKTTLLRMIAGFNTIEGGEFYFDDIKINDKNPAKRNIGMVFQNYAIFPHLTVEKNVRFGLKARNLPADQIKRDTDEFLKLMQIYEYRKRLPDRLSGGQQQRVALARALVLRPDVLLMDEPLSNLDAKLRVEMRAAIKELQNSLHITTIYVTHDQEEAMAVSDRIAVMDYGEIQQIGSPRELYQRPQNVFVATFIGKTNMIDAELVMQESNPTLQFLGGYSVGMPNVHAKHHINQSVKVSIRPEEFLINESGDEGIEAEILDSVFLGLNTHYFMETAQGERVDVVTESDIHVEHAKGAKVRLTLNLDKINVFNQEGTSNILLEEVST
ncbi:MAG: ABC transporter ATP-binding protein, partial [Sphaerochaetaceae bacterium]